MARRVKSLTGSVGAHDAPTHTSVNYFSQTPGDYGIDNYYLRELQDKVDAEWDYRPNRILAEYETERASDVWAPIEVVTQTIKNDRGKEISEDYVKLVFRDIRESRFSIGDKFRYARDYDISRPPREKEVWLVQNINVTSLTQSVVARRCNCTLGSLFVDGRGIASPHYEPAIVGSELSGVSLDYNTVAVSPHARLVVIVQYNEYTKRYLMNQRFIVGASYINEHGDEVAQVYRINTIDRFYGGSTNDPQSVGLIRIYMEITESSEYDDFENRIAYQEQDYAHIVSDEARSSTGKTYSIAFRLPEEFPTALFSTPIGFVPVVVDDGGTDVPELSARLRTRCSLENAREGLFPQYVDFSEDTDGSYGFSLARKRLYLGGSLNVECYLPAEVSPSGTEIKATFSLSMREQEV